MPDVSWRWLESACVGGALLGGVMGSWLVLGPFAHALAFEPLHVVEHGAVPQTSRDLPASVESGEPPAVPVPASTAHAPNTSASDSESRAPQPVASPPMAAKNARRTAPRARPVLPRAVAPRARPPEVSPADELRSAALVIDLNAKPDLDLMDVPSSPLEAQSLEHARARRAASLERFSLIPDAPSLASAVQSGTLNVNSQPWALVYIDERLVGNTPLRTWKLAPGEHVLRLLNRQYALDRTVTVLIRPGETLTYVETGRD
jgi:hypothetical protein